MGAIHLFVTRQVGGEGRQMVPPLGLSIDLELVLFRVVPDARPHTLGDERFDQ